MLNNYFPFFAFQREKYQLKKKNQNPVEWAKGVSTPMTMPTYIAYLKHHAKDAKSFIIVRHPFERLVSAFRDKIERLHSKTLVQDYYYKLVGKSITQKYRAGALRVFGEDFFSKENNYGALLPVVGKLKRVPELPTFWEFVQDVLDTNPEAMNEHWAPIHVFCSICMIKYEVIIKFENLEHEETWLKRYLKVEQMLPDRYVNQNPYKSLTSSDITQIYFSVLTDQMVKDLYRVYKKDFEMFDYTFQLRDLSFP